MNILLFCIFLFRQLQDPERKRNGAPASIAQGALLFSFFPFSGAAVCRLFFSSCKKRRPSDPSDASDQNAINIISHNSFFVNAPDAKISTNLAMMTEIFL